MRILDDHDDRRRARIDFWTRAPPGRKKIFQKEQQVVVVVVGKKPRMSTYLEHKYNK